MTPEDPRHGTYAGALQHWRDGEVSCDACRVAANRSRKARDLDRIAGRPRIVELGEEAHRVLTTHPRIQIEKRTGIKRSKITLYIDAGPTGRVHRRTRERILAAAGGWTLIGLTRRVQALSALGWSTAALARETGLNKDSLGGLRTGGRTFVRHNFAETLVEHYDRLQGSLPPEHRGSSRVRADARRNKWAPPAAWDDIDDPDEKPSGVVADRRRKQHRKADALAEAEWLMSFGESFDSVAKALNLAPESLADYLREAEKEAA